MRLALALLVPFVAASLLAACSSSTPDDAATADGSTSGPSSVASTTGSGGPTTSSASSGSGGSNSFREAPHPPAPQVVSTGGPVLTTPKVVAITYSDDPNAADVDKFMTQIAASKYWAETTSEYGVGPLVVSPPVHRQGAPGSISEQQLLADLQANTTGNSPAWGAVDINTIYVFVLPTNTTFSDAEGGSCCDYYDGFHDETNISNQGVVYSIICSCDATSIDEMTVTIAHELIEAATDPYVESAPAYEMPADKDAAWILLTSGEVGDMCEFDADSEVVPPDMTYAVQRTWSNKAAAAGHDPCVPAADEPYVNAAPVVNDTVSVSFFGEPFQANGVKIPVGGSATIDVDLFSDAPSEDWMVQAFDYNEFMGGGAKNLDLSLDKSSGKNGDVLKLTIKVSSKNADLGGEMFILESDMGAEQNFWVGVVGN